MNEQRLSEARENFRSHVQSVAFQMSLSRNMIQVLHVVRDWGYEAAASPQEDTAGQEWRAKYPKAMSWFVPHVQALERRGLIYHDRDQKYLVNNIWRPPVGHRTYKLTHAGSLMCELLVEAGLLPVESEENRGKRATA